MVAVSTDTPGKITAGRATHGLRGTFIADPELAVTDQFGLRNTNIAARPPGLPGLPIPTTLLLDGNGVVVWKDQSVDYMQRSDPEYVRAAFAEFL